MDTAEQLQTFIKKNFYVPDDTPFDNDTSLLDTGIIDSTGALEIVTFIEDTFSIEVDDDEMLPDNLDTVARIAKFVANKKGN